MLHIITFFPRLLPCFVFIIVALEARETPHCSFIYDNSFDRCNNSSYSEDYRKQNLSRADCPTSGICSKIFNITHVVGRSFSEKTRSKIFEMLYQCCGECSTYIHGNLSTGLAHIDLATIERSDIVYPILGRPSLHEMYNFHYIPVFEVPGAYYFTMEMTEKEMAQSIIMGCLGMWPLLVICVLWALIAGFFIWVFETAHNVDEFPRPFLIGLFEGFWWSFVTMTTVGYGDKTPKQICGRLFSVVWVLIGITITSIYIGGLAGLIVGMESTEKPVLNGRAIGGLKHQLQDATIVAQHGGILHDISNDDPVLGVAELIQQLKDKTVQGIVINKATYQDFFHATENDEKYKDVKEQVSKVHMSRNELDYKGEKVVTGILIKTQEDYEFFKRYFDNNWMQIQACNSFKLNAKDHAFSYSGASHFEGLFYPFFYGTVIVLAVIFGIGCIYEIYRFKCHKKHVDEKVELYDQNEKTVF